MTDRPTRSQGRSKSTSWTASSTRSTSQSGGVYAAITGRLSLGNQTERRSLAVKW
jgi:hypothetical protein